MKFRPLHDRVRIRRVNVATEVKLDGDELLIMNESDIMGIIEGGAAIKKKAA